jgi:fructose/tagatose bisphosphate aldolase
MNTQSIQNLVQVVNGAVKFENGRLKVTSASRLREQIYQWVEIAALGSGQEQATARYLTRLAALELQIFPASIHDLYLARGKEQIRPTFTTPAMNLRALPFLAARAVFRVADRLQAGAFIFEIARSEMGYTDQKPSEYATHVLAAAIAEGYQGPVFIQGDHFQVSAKRYTTDPEAELQAVKELTVEAIEAGFFNIDIDTSTLVDLSKPTVPEQQAVNASLTAMFTALIRQRQPDGITISVGGEIGEVGGTNSTEEELRAYIDSYQHELARQSPGAVGLSKISIQTGTSHGGVVLPDGSIARVSVDFETLLRLSRIARQEYGMGGAVQHGASTLPESAFNKFVESEAIEVHLATNFQNILYNHLPVDLRDEMYAYLDRNHSHERKADQTDEQFYYKTRKQALGPFKRELMHMPEQVLDSIASAWEKQFIGLFERLGVADTRRYIDEFILPVHVQPKLSNYLDSGETTEEVSDLAD